MSMALNLMASGETRGPLNFFARGMLMSWVDDVRRLEMLREIDMKGEEKRGSCGYFKSTAFIHNARYARPLEFQISCSHAPFR